MSKPRRVMVIDDSEVMLARIKRALVAEGYDVIATTHPVGNARHLPTCDLVILDFHMPGLDGSSVVASLRALANSLKNECQLFVYSSDKKVESDYARLGFDGAITSKGDEQALVRQVAAVFRRLDIKAALREKQRA
jgi:two-component system OmpR family response regulator